jgi:hypothetical protein
MGRKPPRRSEVAPAPPVGEESLPLAERLRLREQFFHAAGIDPRQFLQAFGHVPGCSIS